MSWQVETAYPVAFDSYDHLYPHGTARDNHASGNFNRKLFKLFDGKITVMDLGCSGGGFVKSVIDDGHEAVGLEGSDYSLKAQRAEWATIPDNLFTCDISRLFIVHDGNYIPYHFDVITAWEVVEHIEEDRLPQLWENVYAHLKTNGLFILTTSMEAFHEIYVEHNLHRTRQGEDWWQARISEAGFHRQHNLEEYFGNSWVRRGRNYRHVYRKID